jgi:hypothetical protein
MCELITQLHSSTTKMIEGAKQTVGAHIAAKIQKEPYVLGTIY